MTTTAAAKNVALIFCPALNLPTSTWPGRRRLRRRNQRASSRVQRLMRPRSRRSCAPHRPATPRTTGRGSRIPAYTWTWRNSSRRPNIAENGPAYSTAPVSISTPNSAAVVQCAARSTRSKRGITAASWCVVVPVVRASDPRVDVVAAVFPVAGDDLIGHLDPVEPLDRLVAVHRRDVEPHRTAVGVRQLFAFELIGHEDVVAPSLLQREALRIRSVERPESQRLRARLHTGAVQDVAEADALPLDGEDPPARHALEVAGQAGRRHRPEIAVRERERLVDEAGDAEAILVVRAMRHRSRDRVDAEPADRQQPGQSRAVLRQVRADVLLEPTLRLRAPQNPRRARAEQSQEHPPADRRAVHAVRIRTHPPGWISGGWRVLRTFRRRGPAPRRSRPRPTWRSRRRRGSRACRC